MDANNERDTESVLKALGFYLAEAHEIYGDFMPTSLFDFFVTEPSKGLPIIKEQVEQSGRVSEDAARRFDFILGLIGDGIPQGELKKHEEEILMCAYFAYEGAFLDAAFEMGRESR